MATNEHSYLSENEIYNNYENQALTVQFSSDTFSNTLSDERRSTIFAICHLFSVSKISPDHYQGSVEKTNAITTTNN